MKILLLTFLCPQKDPRPSRFLNYFEKNNFKIDVLYNTRLINQNPRKNILEKIDYFWLFLKPIFLKILKLFLGFFPFTKKLLLKINFLEYRYIVPPSFYKLSYNYILVEDIFLLPFAFKFNKNCKVIFDAREFYPLQREDIIFKVIYKPLYHYICKKFLPLCHLIFTVSDGLKLEYKRMYGVETRVLFSAPSSNFNIVKKTSIKNIKLIHHGIANRNRKLENMVEVATRLEDRFSVHFRLTGNSKYITELQNSVRGSKKIFFEEPVPLDQITSMLNQYDLGFYYLEPDCFNLKNCLPNKFFEFIHGKLGIVIGPSPEMKKILTEYSCGFYPEHFSIDAMANMINNLNKEQIDKAKSNSYKLSKILCWENEQNKLKSVFV